MTFNAPTTFAPGQPDFSENLNATILAAAEHTKPAGTSLQYVDADNGSDSADGLSWGTAKLTLAAARTAMPAGGRLLLNVASAEYNLTSALDWGGYAVEAVARVSGLADGLAVVRHKYNGNLFDFGAKGGSLRNLLLYEDDVTASRTGAAIAVTSSASAGGTVLVENVIISSSAGPNGINADGWERDVVLDGTAWTSFGVRKCEFINCQFFGCRTAGETIKITRGVHCKFVNGFVDPAPTAVTQGVKLLDTGTTDVQFVNFETLGNFSTEAAGQCCYTGRITGTVTCAASSAENTFVGRCGSSFTNSGAATNVVIGTVGGEVRTPDLALASTWVGNQSFEGTVAGQASAVNGVKRLRVTGGAAAAEGLVENYSRLGASANHSFGSFPDPGAGQLYANAALAVGDRAATTNIARIYAGTGSPEGVLAGNIGDLYLRRDGSTSTTLYVKTSGSGNTGWTAK